MNELRSLKINLVVVTKVISIERRSKRMWTGGIGKDATFDEQDLGWFATFEGSYESLWCGSDQPKWNEGDAIKITFEKV